MSEWQAMETAPKDGTVIQALAASGEVVAVSWGLAEKHGRRMDGDGTADETYPWLTFDPACNGLNAYMAEKLTHWAPLSSNIKEEKNG